jgi:hypothetical protein
MYKNLLSSLALIFAITTVMASPQECTPDQHLLFMYVLVKVSIRLVSAEFKITPFTGTVDNFLHILCTRGCAQDHDVSFQSRSCNCASPVSNQRTTMANKNKKNKNKKSSKAKTQAEEPQPLPTSKVLPSVLQATGEPAQKILPRSDTNW